MVSIINQYHYQIQLIESIQNAALIILILFVIISVAFHLVQESNVK